MSKLKLLIEQEVEDFIQTQQEKILKFEDDPMGYILQKYPSLEETYVIYLQIVIRITLQEYL